MGITYQILILDFRFGKSSFSSENLTFILLSVNKKLSIGISFPCRVSRRKQQKRMHRIEGSDGYLSWRKFPLWWQDSSQMRPSWLHILSGKQFEEAFENTQRRKIKQMQPMWFRILSVNHIWGLIFKHTVEISQNKCNQCVFGSFGAGNLRTQMKTHSGKKSNKCNFCD